MRGNPKSSGTHDATDLERNVRENSRHFAARKKIALKNKKEKRKSHKRATRCNILFARDITVAAGVGGWGVGTGGMRNRSLKISITLYPAGGGMLDLT